MHSLSNPSGRQDRPLVWADGGVIFCACSHCGAPLSVRPELMMADCWKCECSVELSEEQEREVLRLLEQIEERRNEPAAPPRPAARPPQPPRMAKTDPDEPEASEEDEDEKLRRRFGGDRFQSPTRKKWGVRKRFGLEG